MSVALGLRGCPKSGPCGVNVDNEKGVSQSTLFNRLNTRAVKRYARD